MKHFCILGHNNNVLAVLLDLLSVQYPQQYITVDIIGNVPPEENNALTQAYATPGIVTHEIFHTEWQPRDYDGYFMGAIGQSKKAIFEFFRDKFGIQADRYEHQIHPSAIIGSSITYGHSFQISPLSVIAPQAQLGNFVSINRHCSIGHHTQIDDYVVVRPGSHIAGNCHIGTGVAIGAGATIIDKIKIGENSIIGAGSVVTRDIPAGVMAYGVPAKVVKTL
jgi:sugar O-acyltransferase (sialic acid O-acetyltransferase NeuD family)